MVAQTPACTEETGNTAELSLPGWWSQLSLRLWEGAVSGLPRYPPNSKTTEWPSAGLCVVFVVLLSPFICCYFCAAFPTSAFCKVASVGSQLSPSLTVLEESGGGRVVGEGSFVLLD